MIDLIIVALVMLAVIYLAWGYARRLTRTTIHPEDTGVYRRPDTGRVRESSKRQEHHGHEESNKKKGRGDLVVVYTPEEDHTIEASEEISWHIPEADIDFSRYPEFGEDQCVLIARDNETLFAYWEVTFPSVDRYARTTRDQARPRIVLRVYDAQDPADKPWFMDVDVNSRMGTYYLPIPVMSQAFYAEIGLIGSHGFWPIARSAIASVPLSVFGESTQISEYERRARMGIGVSSR